jgi:malonyl-CoA O-methyltransferase
VKNLKEKIRKNFSAAASCYQQWAKAQDRAAGMLVSMLPGIDVRSALDIGCGTGFLTGRLGRKYRNADITGIDIADGMIDSCIKSWPGHRFLRVDAESYRPGKKFGLVASNFTYQWIKDTRGILRKGLNSTATGGIFAFSVPVKGSLRELRSAFGEKRAPILEFPEKDGFISALRKSGAEILKTRVHDVTVFYDGPVEALKSLKKIGAGFDTGRRLGHIEMSRGLKKYAIVYGKKSGKCPLTYRVLFAVARKKAE